jgi:HD superfamily phosphodiesterase
MENMLLTRDHIVQMTLQAGEDWAISHAERLLTLICLIGRDLAYDVQIMEMAAYMHDWGAFPCYAQKGVEHAIRSRQVVEAQILPYLQLTPQQETTLLETIELHDYRDLRPTKSTEALLLREADMLEFLGSIGVARDFARGPKNIEVCYKRIRSRLADIQNRFTLPGAQEIAHIRLERMSRFLEELEEESLGCM